MSSKFREYKQLNLKEVHKETLEFWKENKIFEKSISERQGKPSFIFYEGPPSANGMPGIHHVMARAIKDIFCRYKTQKGFLVNRKAGWDTHGLPIELGVEKTLGITKEDIGSKISVEDYNKACRKEVMKYTDVWNKLTEEMGYWVDMNDPYITYDNKYIESVWWLLKQIYSKGLIYKGYTIQPYSPKAGTGLSSHELNQPGCYRDVKDTSMVAFFKIIENQANKDIFVKAFKQELHENTGILAWTTTPWTLPSNTALTVGEKIDYVLVSTFNMYTKEPQRVVLAKELLAKNFGKNFEQINDVSVLENYDAQNAKAKIPFMVLAECKGSDLLELKYEQLLPYAQPMDGVEDAFRVIAGDFVTTEDGTGIVHTAPTFGADDARVAKTAGVPPMLVADEHGNPIPLVDLRGKFLDLMNDEIFGLGGEYIKEEYLADEEKEIELQKQQERLSAIIPKLDKYLSVDERIALKLKIEGKAFKIEKYEHSYPHCWRTDKPVLYYPLDSWFIKTTEVKEQMIANNKKIQWKPESTGTGRFGNWLENVNDWNLSRSRFWGIPLPIWRNDEGTEAKCIGSVAELKAEMDKSVKAGFMTTNPLAEFVEGDLSAENYARFDLHKPYADDIILVSDSGKPMKREADLIDVWFDSGAMPFAQYHFPFAQSKELKNLPYPADFIAEGVDQTRGWFYTLHAISTLVFDSIAYKTVISNGLVLDKNGQKMSKRLGNAVDPFTTIEKYGTDAVRWYMITNAQPWDNLKFDLAGIEEVQRKFFGTLYNTYSFFALYANVDNFIHAETKIPVNQRPEIDRWVLSELHTLIKEVDKAFEEYEPTRAGRAIQYFVTENLSNWYVRLCRRRFWKGDYAEDKIAAYQTLFECLYSLSKLMAPIAPFFADRLYRDLNEATGLESFESVHLAHFPVCDNLLIDSELEKQTHLAQQISSMVLSLRKKERLKVRQPLQKIMIPALQDDLAQRIERVKDLVLAEVNVKELEILSDVAGRIVKKIKPDFKKLGAKLGKAMKEANQIIAGLNQEQIQQFEAQGNYELTLSTGNVVISLDEVEILTDDIPGWLVASERGLTVALDITLNDELIQEGIARELVNRLQNLRKENGLEVTDRIRVHLSKNESLERAVAFKREYIQSEVLANNIEFHEHIEGETLDMDEIVVQAKILKD